MTIPLNLPTISRICILTLCLSFTPIMNVQADLVGHYTFDDGGDLFADSSGFANHGSTLTGTPTQDLVNVIAGIGALSLNGSSAGEINAIADNVPTGTHTLSAWIRTTAEDRPTYLSANTPSGGNSNMLFITTGENATAQVFSLPDDDAGGSFIAIAPNPVVNDNTYHHVVWVKSGSDGVLYVDGVQRATSDQANYVRTINDLWSIGQEFDDADTGDFWMGQIDDIQIYDTALSSTEVSFLFSNPGTPVPIPEPSTMLLLSMAGVGGWWVRRSRGKGNGNNSSN